jgi:hypothetical protein
LLDFGGSPWAALSLYFIGFRPCDGLS